MRREVVCTPNIAMGHKVAARDITAGGEKVYKVWCPDWLRQKIRFQPEYSIRHNLKSDT